MIRQDSHSMDSTVLDHEGFGESYADVNIACTKWLRSRGLIGSPNDFSSYDRNKTNPIHSVQREP
jgi:hypothetical protein